MTRVNARTWPAAPQARHERRIRVTRRWPNPRAEARGPHHPAPPHVVDDCKVCEARAAGLTATTSDGQAVDPPTGRPDRVYTTSDREYARFYASRYWYGDLYTVEPVGETEASTEDPWPTWCVPAARVVSVYTRAVQLTPHQRRTLLQRWAKADQARGR
ncbi:hypothetical protein [Streptomyces sp. NPDC001978]|uniref:hypothetical protein n=1 Tax=Streptomyces sp. NPDC001978 TaxID=3364627 RepID=UPI0036C57250